MAATVTIDTLAHNMDIVDQMKAVYEEALTAFVDKVVERVRALIHPAKLCYTSKQKWVSFWIGEDCEKEDKERGGSTWGSPFGNAISSVEAVST
jgi:hypothetical protein